MFQRSWIDIHLKMVRLPGDGPSTNTAADCSWINTSQKQFLIIIIRWTTLSHSVLFHSFNYFFILKVTWLEELYASVDFLTMSDTQCYFPAFLIQWRFDSSSINPKPFLLPNYAYKAEYKAENRVILKHNSM